MRGDHEEVERLAGVAHRLVDGAYREVRLLGVGRQPDDLRAQLQGLLVPEILKISIREMPEMMCNTTVAHRNPHSASHCTREAAAEPISSALAWFTAAREASAQLQPLQSRHRLRGPEQGIARTSGQAAI